MIGRRFKTLIITFKERERKIVMKMQETITMRLGFFESINQRSEISFRKENSDKNKVQTITRKYKEKYNLFFKN